MDRSTEGSPDRCQKCDVQITSSEAGGLCPRCLLEVGLGGQEPTVILDGRAPKPVPSPMFPFDFGGYRVLRLLGQGGMGAVYEAEQVDTGRRIALKLLEHSLDSPEARRRFLREGRLAASINHPNSVYIFGTEEIDGTPVIAMELVAGGTLHERVADHGPLPVGEAVDTILQIIDGLETAAALGVLHRDIKPANCFIDTDGTVKIGDFGLSISTLARNDSLLTNAGLVMGTPAYSSPEQLRGEVLDVRSDIYSVGVTLFFLLTGRAPFEGENVVALLATVLEKAAPSPRQFRQEIPKSLARVVVRCLAKPAGDRFKTYDDLRQALSPFASIAPTPATLGLRFVAGAIDQIVILLLINLVFLLTDVGFDAPEEQFAVTAFHVAVMASKLAYFSIFEGLWGASLGKALVGLRVTRLDRSPPGIPKALLRTVLFLLKGLIALLASPAAGRDEDSVGWAIGSAIASVLFYTALFSTARRRNGFAGFHDLWTKTRVIQKSAVESRIALSHNETPLAATDPLRHLGPYHVLTTLASRDGDDILVGYDTTLLRRVWICKTKTTQSNVAVAPIRGPARPGRLRWLQGICNGDSWDVYEAVSGAPLINLVQTPQPWKSVRLWVRDLAEELAASAHDGSLDSELALDRVWITADGRAKLLDFRAPGAEKSTESVPGVESSVFLNQLSISALEGCIVGVSEAQSRAPKVPLPLAARGFFQKLRYARDMDTLALGVADLVRLQPCVTRRRRMILMAACTVPILSFGAMTLMIGRTLVRSHEMSPEVRPLSLYLAAREQLTRGEFPSLRNFDLAAAPSALDLYIAGRFGDLVRDAETWNSSEATRISAPRRAEAERIVAAHPALTELEMQDSVSRLTPLIDWIEQGLKTFEKTVDQAVCRVIGGTVAGLAALSAFWAIAFRGGPLMRVLGIAAVRSDGTDASGPQMLWRACVAWSPCLLLFFAAGIEAIALVGLLLAGVAIWSALLPERSLQDRIAGTWLVPR